MIKRGLALISLALGLSTGCKTTTSSDWQVDTRNEKPDKPAPDQLNSDDLLEGEQKVFELILPRRLSPTSRFAHAAKAAGFVNSEALRRYIAFRVESADVELLPGRTLFKNARLKSAPNKVYLIEISTNQGKVELTLRDQTPIKKNDGLSRQARLKEAGFKPDGSLANAETLE